VKYRVKRKRYIKSGTQDNGTGKRTCRFHKQQEEDNNA